MKRVWLSGDNFLSIQADRNELKMYDVNGNETIITFPVHTENMPIEKYVDYINSHSTGLFEAYMGKLVSSNQIHYVVLFVDDIYVDFKGSYLNTFGGNYESIDNGSRGIGDVIYPQS